jgi:integrase
VTLERFAAFVADHQPEATEFVAVKPETAKAFMAAEEARGVSPKTWNDALKLLRATFKHLHPHLNDGSNPFHGLVTKATETVNREPFTVEELKAILDACGDDDFIRPVIVTGMCTAMRRGDCCLLKWKDVDHKEGFITVKTAKTGETVDIPMFPMLREELTRIRAAVGKSPFCFP